jgi:hypothetical protein
MWLCLFWPHILSPSKARPRGLGPLPIARVPSPGRVEDMGAWVGPSPPSRVPS